MLVGFANRRCGACCVAARPLFRFRRQTCCRHRCTVTTEEDPCGHQVRTSTVGRMATHPLTVEDVFDIPSRGLVIVPGPLENSYVGPRESPFGSCFPTLMRNLERLSYRLRLK